MGVNKGSRLDDSSMFWINGSNGIAQMEADNNNLFVTAPTDEDLDNHTKPFIDA